MSAVQVESKSDSRVTWLEVTAAV